MKKGIMYSLVVTSISLLAACSGKFQTYDLSRDYATSLHYQPVTGEDASEEEEEKDDLVGVPARNYYGGDLKRGGFWWAGKGLTLEKGDEFILHAEQVLPDSGAVAATNSIDLEGKSFGATFPPIDMIKEAVAIKVSMRAEAKDSTQPVLYLQVEDVNGTKADAKRPFHTVAISSEFKDYYFEMKEVYVQAEPKKKVNGAMINSLKFFINPGKPGYIGEIYIKEIKVVSSGEVK